MRRTILIALALIMLFSAFIFAAPYQETQTRSVGQPSMTTIGSDVLCSAKVFIAGKYIEADLELYQGATLVASWHKTGNSLVTFSETENFTSGLSYTLTISGTANGVAFTPQSTTQTLW